MKYIYSLYIYLKINSRSNTCGDNKQTLQHHSETEKILWHKKSGAQVYVLKTSFTLSDSR